MPQCLPSWRFGGYIRSMPRVSLWGVINLGYTSLFGDGRWHSVDTYRGGSAVQFHPNVDLRLPRDWSPTPHAFSSEESQATLVVQWPLWTDVVNPCDNL